MSNFKVHILGCGSATPTLRHMPSSQVVDHNGRLFMIDCGEGAQLGMRRAGLPFMRLRHIFISHLHGDHILGLPGLLSTFTLHDFTGELHVFMLPEGIPVIKECMRVFAHEPEYTLVFHPLPLTPEVIYSDNTLEVSTFLLRHGVPALGFVFREKPKPRHLRADMLEYYHVPIKDRPLLKIGVDYVTDDGQRIPNSWLTTDPDPSRSYAYSSDTAYSRKVAEAVRGVDLLYHEATYADDNAAKAAARGHSTARQAARIAREAGVGRLLIGHYSKQYAGQEQLLLEQAREEFPNTILADEGMTVDV